MYVCVCIYVCMCIGSVQKVVCYDRSTVGDEMQMGGPMRRMQRMRFVVIILTQCPLTVLSVMITSLQGGSDRVFESRPFMSRLFSTQFRCRGEYRKKLIYLASVHRHIIIGARSRPHGARRSGRDLCAHHPCDHHARSLARITHFFCSQ